MLVLQGMKGASHSSCRRDRGRSILCCALVPVSRAVPPSPMLSLLMHLPGQIETLTELLVRCAESPCGEEGVCVISCDNVGRVGHRSGCRSPARGAPVRPLRAAPADAGCERSFRRARRCGIFPRRGAPWSRHGWAATAASPTRWSIGSQATCVCPPAPSSVHVEQCEPAPLSCSAQRLLDRTGAAQQGALPMPCVATRCSMLRVIPPEAGRRPAMSRRRAASRCQRRCVLRPRGHLKRLFDQSQERGLLTSLKTGVGFRAGVPLRLSARTRAHAALSATRSQAWGL
jgi:hypothetical protein